MFIHGFLAGFFLLLIVLCLARYVLKNRVAIFGRKIIPLLGKSESMDWINFLVQRIIKNMGDIHTDYIDLHLEPVRFLDSTVLDTKNMRVILPFCFSDGTEFEYRYKRVTLNGNIQSLRASVMISNMEDSPKVFYISFVDDISIRVGLTVTLFDRVQMSLERIPLLGGLVQDLAEVIASLIVLKIEF